jgi:hypothetical protein
VSPIRSNYVGVARYELTANLGMTQGEASQAKRDGDDKYLTTSILVPSPLRSPLRADTWRSVSKFLTNLEILSENWFPYREGVSFTTSA